jgi:PiT family inorganic phosphate transporter
MLVFTSAGVSLSHGSNDGQKGVGLIMIILIATLPAHFSLNPEYGTKRSGEVIHSLEQTARVIEHNQNGILADVSAKGMGTQYMQMGWTPRLPHPISRELEEVTVFMEQHDRLALVSPEERSQLRKKILLLEDHIKSMEQTANSDLSDAEKSTMKRLRVELRAMTDYAPAWVILIVAAAIGLGTMVGWKRVVVTVGERIGKSPLTYAQGASSELVAMTTIGLAAAFGLPVSTTHVLSSGVTGTMVANGVGLRYRTVREIALAWILTLPVTMLLGGTLFLLFHSLAKL